MRVCSLPSLPYIVVHTLDGYFRDSSGTAVAFKLPFYNTASPFPSTEASRVLTMEVDLRGKGAERTLHFRYHGVNLKYFFTDLPDCVEFVVCCWRYRIQSTAFSLSSLAPLNVHLNYSHSESYLLLHSQTLPQVMHISGTLNLIQSAISFLFHSGTSQPYFFYSSISFFIHSWLSHLSICTLDYSD